MDSAGEPLKGFRGKDAAYNAEVVRRVMSGEGGPVRDAVVLNAGAALAIHTSDIGPQDSLRVGVARAQRSIDSGAAASLLGQWIEATSSAEG